MDSSLTGLLGLARRAGKAELGEESILSAALAHKARLVLIAADAAPGTTQRLERAAETGNAVCFRTDMTKAELGSCFGRASCAAVALTDVGLAAAAVEKLSQADPQRYGEASAKLKSKAEKTVRRRREKQRRLKAAKAGKPWAAPSSKEAEDRFVGTPNIQQ